MLADRHRRLIQVTLQAAAPFGAALGGRNALALHGLTGQTTKQIDVVTSREAVPQAAAAVDEALRQAGYRADRQPQAPELENTWPPARQTAVEWHVRKPEPHDHPPIGGIRDYYCLKCHDRDYLGLSRAPRSRDPVPTELGPVLHPEDAAGQKVADLARRGRIRDYAATADLLEHYRPEQLIGFARRLDPQLHSQDFTRTAERLDQMPEIALTAMGALEPRDVPRLRDRFASWPRDARQIDRDHPERERIAPGRDLSGRPPPQCPAPGQPVWQPSDPAQRRQLHHAEPAKPGPGKDIQPSGPTPAASIPVLRLDAGKRHAASQQRREREADRKDPEIER